MNLNLNGRPNNDSVKMVMAGSTHDWQLYLVELSVSVIQFVSVFQMKDHLAVCSTNNKTFD